MVIRFVYRAQHFDFNNYWLTTTSIDVNTLTSTHWLGFITLATLWLQHFDFNTLTSTPWQHFDFNTLTWLQHVDFNTLTSSLWLQHFSLIGWLLYTLTWLQHVLVAFNTLTWLQHIDLISTHWLQLIDLCVLYCIARSCQWPLQSPVPLQLPLLCTRLQRCQSTRRIHSQPAAMTIHSQLGALSNLHSLITTTLARPRHDTRDWPSSNTFLYHQNSEVTRDWGWGVDMMLETVNSRDP